MALRTLEKLLEVNDCKVKHIGVNEPCCATDPIVICDENSIIRFKIQDGPIKECGINGCQVDDILLVIKTMIEGLNQQFPCRENSMVITKLDEALFWLWKRKRDREERSVEGFSKE